MGKGIVYMLQHGNSEPRVHVYDNVDNEYHFCNILAGAMIIGNEDGTFNDKVFGYLDETGTWYHACPDNQEEKTPDETNVVKCNVCGGSDFSEYDQDTIICQDCNNCQIFEGGEKNG